MTVRILQGHVLDRLAELPDGSVHCVVTSPPYWGLRAYSTAPQAWGGDPAHAHAWGEPVRAPWANEVPGQNTHGKNHRRNWSKQAGAFCGCGAWLGELGQEPAPDLYVEHMVAIFREVRRALHPTGTLWCNIGDSYAGSGKGPTGHTGIGDQGRRQGFVNDRRAGRGIRSGTGYELRDRGGVVGCKPKDLVGIPWMLAFALRADGWWLRSNIRWCKRAPMPESVKDRPTSAVEDIFLFARAERYFYDDVATRETAVSTHASGNGYARPGWNYWLLNPEPFAEAHFATFPPEVPKRCILAGTSEAGACRACLSPWVRVVNRRHVNPGNRSTNGAKYADMKHQPGGSAAYAARLELGVETLGWRPSCRCDAGEPVPCVVLDPFGGAGTTGLVADRLGRDALLIELNTNYAAMARRRIDEDAPMVSEPVTVEAAVQMSLEGMAG